MTNKLKSATKNSFMSVRLTSELHKQVKQRAKANDRTISAQIVNYIKRGLEHDAKKEGSND
jgi:predicted transcriptional regulator